MTTAVIDTTTPGATAADEGAFAARERAVWQRHSGAIAWPTLLLAVCVLAGTAAVWAAVLAGGLSVWAGAVIMVVVGYLAFTPAHEAAHGNVGGRGSRAWLDAAAGWTSSVVLIAPFPAFRHLHLLHHAVANDPERDPDHWVATRGPLRVALRCLTILFHYYAVALTPQPDEPRAVRRMRAKSVVGIVGLVAVFAALVAAGLWREALLLWIVPGWLASALLAFAFDWLPHQPHASRERYDNARIILFPGLSVLMAGHSYHLIHHLYPRVPFYRYGAVFHALRGGLEARGAPVVDWRA